MGEFTRILDLLQADETYSLAIQRLSFLTFFLRSNRSNWILARSGDPLPTSSKLYPLNACRMRVK